MSSVPVPVVVNVALVLTGFGFFELWDESEQLLDRRSVDANSDPLLLGSDRDAVHADTETMLDRLYRLQEVEFAKYGRDLCGRIETLASEDGCLVAVSTIVDWGGLWMVDELPESVQAWVATAILETPLPGSGLPPAAYPPGEDIADIERSAGRLPHTRIADAG